MKTVTRTFVFAILTVQCVISAVLRVPSEYESIQHALSEIANGDTILIATGVYVESLVAPQFDFMMRGEIPIDSQTTEFSIIDPSDLRGSDTLLTVRLTGGNARFEDVVFRNRAAMIQDRPQSDESGIKGDTMVHSVSFKRCVFDSLISAVSRIDSIKVSNCRFIGCKGAIYTGFWRGKLIADSTWFDGSSGLVDTQEGCVIENCLFTHAGPSPIIIGVGNSLIIKGCRFVGTGPMLNSALQLRARCGSIVKDCIFEDILVQNRGILNVQDSCHREPEGVECAIKILNNRFIRCGTPVGIPSNGGVMIVARCSESANGYAATLENNHIDSTQAVSGRAIGFETNGGCRVEHTVFGDALTPNKPQMYIESVWPPDSLVFRNNSFSRFFNAIEYVWSGSSSFDARYNWWGDPSGPYHGDLNPNGLGAQVDDHIFFYPWLTVDPDSSDTNGVFIEHHDVLTPSSYALSVYPNPFNGLVRVNLTVPSESSVTARTYDLTGRLVHTLLDNRRVAQNIRLEWNASDNAAGIYFLRCECNGISETRKLVYLP